MNSQTLHFGDIETNYTYDKATKVKRTADMMKNYLNNIKTEPRMMSQYLSTLKQNGENELFTVYNKMVIAVGPQEVDQLIHRYEMIQSLYPHLQLIDGD